MIGLRAVWVFSSLRLCICINMKSISGVWGWAGIALDALTGQDMWSAWNKIHSQSISTFDLFSDSSCESMSNYKN